jgi:phosphocarrier protein
MTRFQYTIQDAIGLHARPVGLVAKVVAQFQNSNITISCGDQTADAKRIFAMMALQARQGDTITVCVDGGDEQQIAEAIRNVFVSENL